MNDDMNVAFLEGLNERLDKKHIKLGEVKKKFKDVIYEQHILEDEIKVIENTIKKYAQDSNN